MNCLISLTFVFILFSVFGDAVSGHDCNATVTAFPPDPTTWCCGTEASNTKLIRGSQAELDQYPWLALIEYSRNSSKTNTLCGGSLISSRYVLTTGICTSPTPSDLVAENIILGEYDRSNEGRDCLEQAGGDKDCSDGAIKIPIEKIIVHPQFDRGTKQNDIALIRLAEAAPYTDFIRPICLPNSDITKEKEDRIWFSFAGWGSITGLTAIKKQVMLPFVAKEKCQESYSARGRNVVISDGQLCAGGEQDKDACTGDGGMPLSYERDGKYEVVGLVSFGAKRCGTEDVPSVYTKVYEYKSWIISNIIA